jgi:hypothetical protein
MTYATSIASGLVKSFCATWIGTASTLPLFTAFNASMPEAPLSGFGPSLVKSVPSGPARSARLVDVIGARYDRAVSIADGSHANSPTIFLMVQS